LTTNAAIDMLQSVPASLRAQAPKEPPALHDRAMQDLSFIRRTMEGAAAFTDVPGWGLAITGLSALAATVLAERQPSAGRWITVWLLEAVLGACIGGVMTWRKIHQRPRPVGAPILNAAARKFLLGFWPAVIAGAVLTWALIDPLTVWTPGSAVPRVLPGMWLLLYGVGVTTAGAHSVKPVPMMGAGFFCLGTLALLIPQLPAAVMLALGFGVWQVACGVWIARSYGG
jgi:hypothetical protein